uniref:Uncharacterized protein n=1 Tax=Pararge aegeria TaxID=116150 RepID=S4P351_9NEOP
MFITQIFSSCMETTALTQNAGSLPTAPIGRRIRTSCTDFFFINVLVGALTAEVCWNSSFEKIIHSTLILVFLYSENDSANINVKIQLSNKVYR